MTMRAALLALTALLAAGCGGGPDPKRQDEVRMNPTEKAFDILGRDIQISEITQRREDSTLRAWSFRITNNETATVSLHVFPLFLDKEGRELGGSFQAKDVLIPSGKSQEFFFKAPTGAAVDMIAKFEFK